MFDLIVQFVDTGSCIPIWVYTANIIQFVNGNMRRIMKCTYFVRENYSFIRELLPQMNFKTFEQ